MSQAKRPPFKSPSRCDRGAGCACSVCSYADGYDDARQASMGLHLGTLDTIRSLAPPRRTPTKKALRQLADALDNLALESFGADWPEFVAALRRHVKEGLH